MSLHWWHVAISYVLVLGGFAGLTAAATLRHAQAKRVLARLETRPRRSDRQP
jgi:spermidine synthase